MSLHFHSELRQQRGLHLEQHRVGSSGCLLSGRVHFSAFLPRSWVSVVPNPGPHLCLYIQPPRPVALLPSQCGPSSSICPSKSTTKHHVTPHSSVGLRPHLLEGTLHRGVRLRGQVAGARIEAVTSTVPGACSWQHSKNWMCLLQGSRNTAPGKQAGHGALVGRENPLNVCRRV